MERMLNFEKKNLINETFKLQQIIRNSIVLFIYLFTCIYL